jgi:preprotein translocase subunit SecG
LTTPSPPGSLRLFMTLLIGLFTFVLILVSAFLVLVVLVQKPRTDAGLGAAMGGGAAEAAFGAETGNVLTKATIYAAVAFFVLSLCLYLAHLWMRAHGDGGKPALPAIVAPADLPPASTLPGLVEEPVAPAAPAEESESAP